ncbi:MAG: large conductance mechanosensitive channel protein MscL [Tractidigestivibacter sp.]|jgi:large conductance mechanosensitive channel|uniref:large conductance mechanosensitive channel protein MscL n=1 Tax=Tractidigestivibacter sp. TaxID=2847320 RepID=UPI003D94341D
MKGFMKEFREFIARGNVMDMAVGVIIGGAFTAIVTSLVDDIIEPLISGLTGGEEEIGLVVNVGAAQLNFGAFISAIINFLIIAFIVFLLVKGVNKFSEEAKKLSHQQEVEEEAAAPICPHCLEEVKEGATRCPHCGGEIPGGAKPQN